MKLARWQGPDGREWVGELDGGVLTPMAAGGTDGPDPLLQLAMGDRRRKAIGEPVAVEDVRLLPPIVRPGAIRDFYTFEEHVKVGRARRGLDMDPLWYELPVFYFTNPNVVHGHGDEIHGPATGELDYELEVAAIVGRAGRNLTEDEALDCIAGYTIFNDWSARDVQRREMTMGLGPAKGKDFAHSLGPVLVTPESMAGLRTRPEARMRAMVNGVLYSEGQLSTMYHTFAEAIAYASRDSWVLPGDVIGSGTVGTGCILELSMSHSSERFPWLVSGDVVELEVEGIGVLRNTVRCSSQAEVESP